MLEENNAFIVQGNLDVMSSNKCKIKAQHISPILEVFKNWQLKRLTLDLNNNLLDQEKIKSLRDNLKPGKTSLILNFNENDKSLSLNTLHNVKITEELAQELEDSNYQLVIRA